METANEKLDQFTKNVMQDAGKSTPSVDFLANVMAEVSKEEVPVKVYKPLINRVGWMIIASLFVIFAYVLTRFSLGFSILGDWDLSSLFIKKYNLSFSIPKTYVYCVVFLFVFVLIQVKMITKQFDKRLNGKI